MGDEKFDNTDEAAEDRALGDLLHGLKRVDAPNDFDFKVKARIAEGDPKSSTGWGGLPVPVYIVSLAVVLITGSVFLFRSFYPANSGPVPEVVETRAPLTKPISDPLIDRPSINGKEVATTNANEAGVTDPGANQQPFNRRNPNLDGLRPGSIDQSQGNTEQPLPRGFDPNAARVRTVDPSRGSHIPITDFLNAIGINAGFQGQALKIISVRSGSIADRSGAKAGDIIEALDDTKISPNTGYGGRIDAKSLSIIRGGQRIRIRITIP